ncbi:MAG: metal-dependent hydrolase [Xanthomonadaceae bacterium]|nr:metal-dependent hydrolase [Xanthomonadaceae bacterium]
MTTIVTHALVPLAVGLGLGPKLVPPRLLLVGCLAAMLPDADVVAFRFGIVYSDILGHRGLSHSLLFAAIVGLFATCTCRFLKSRTLPTFLFVTGAVASHIALDMVTNGGLGVALLWPWSEERFFAPWRPVEVSPFLRRFFSERGLTVLLSELRWVWLPMLAASLTLRGIRVRASKTKIARSRDSALL